jgi:hypothetical protein
MYIDIVVLTQICVFFYSFVIEPTHHSEAAAGTHLRWIGILAADSCGFVWI